MLILFVGVTIAPKNRRKIRREGATAPTPTATTSSSSRNAGRGARLRHDIQSDPSDRTIGVRYPVRASRAADQPHPTLLTALATTRRAATAERRAAAGATRAVGREIRRADMIVDLGVKRCRKCPGWGGSRAMGTSSCGELTDDMRRPLRPRIHPPSHPSGSDRRRSRPLGHAIPRARHSRREARSSQPGRAARVPCPPYRGAGWAGAAPLCRLRVRIIRRENPLSPGALTTCGNRVVPTFRSFPRGRRNWRVRGWSARNALSTATGRLAIAARRACSELDDLDDKWTTTPSAPIPQVGCFGRNTKKSITAALRTPAEFDALMEKLAPRASRQEVAGRLPPRARSFPNGPSTE